MNLYTYHHITFYRHSHGLICPSTPKTPSQLHFESAFRTCSIAVLYRWNPSGRPADYSSPKQLQMSWRRWSNSHQWCSQVNCIHLVFVWFISSIYMSIKVYNMVYLHLRQITVYTVVFAFVCTVNLFASLCFIFIFKIQINKKQHDQQLAAGSNMSRLQNTNMIVLNPWTTLDPHGSILSVHTQVVRIGRRRFVHANQVARVHQSPLRETAKICKNHGFGTVKQEYTTGRKLFGEHVYCKHLQTKKSEKPCKTRKKNHRYWTPKPLGPQTGSNKRGPREAQRVGS